MGFWNTQPMFEKTTEPLKIADIEIPEGYRIEECDLQSIPNIIELLSSHYIATAKARLIYSLSLLTNELSKGHRICLYTTQSDGDILIGFIHLTFIDLCIKSQIQDFAAINFLCLKSEFRNKYMAPLLINYSRAIANSKNIFSAVFTGGLNLPGKLIKAQYLHKILPDMPVLYPRKGLRMFEYKDSRPVLNLLRNRTSKMFEFFTTEDIFYDKYKTVPDSVYSFVYEQNNKVVEFGSFFVISVVEDEEKEKNAYLYLYSSSSKNILIDLFAVANKIGCSMFNMLDINKNGKLFDEFQLFKGSGVLNYFLFNYEDVKDIGNDDVDFVMF